MAIYIPSSAVRRLCRRHTRRGAVIYVIRVQATSQRERMVMAGNC